MMIWLSAAADRVRDDHACHRLDRESWRGKKPGK
jgi:hypothetical protein